MKSVILRFFLSMILLLGASVPALAQNVEGGASPGAANAEEGGLPANLRVEAGNELEMQLAGREAEMLKARNLTDIRRLAVLVGNFNSQAPGSTEQLEKIKGLYREGQEGYYTRRFLLARDRHREAHRLILTLYKQFAERFQRQLSEILTQLSTEIVDQEMVMGSEPGVLVTAVERRRVQNGTYKLQLAYQQSANARQMLVQERPDLALDHLRLAKRFAISALTNLQADPAKQQELQTRFRVDLLDAEGQAGNRGSEGGASS